MQFDWSFEFWCKHGTLFNNATGTVGSSIWGSLGFWFEPNDYQNNLKNISVVGGGDSLITSKKRNYCLRVQDIDIPLPTKDLHHVCITRSMIDKKVFVYIDKQLVKTIDVTKNKNFSLGQSRRATHGWSFLVDGYFKRSDN